MHQWRTKKYQNVILAHLQYLLTWKYHNHQMLDRKTYTDIEGNHLLELTWSRNSVGLASLGYRHRGFTFRLGRMTEILTSV
jgi:hypothetical protein